MYDSPFHKIKKREQEDYEKIQISIDRESICMGDDIQSHKEAFVVKRDESIISLFKCVIESNYLPIVSNSIWILYSGQNEMAGWCPEKNQFLFRTVQAENSGDWSGADKNIFFRKFTYLERAKYLFEIYKGQKRWMWHDGCIDEYQFYGIDETTEKKWHENSEF